MTLVSGGFNQYFTMDDFNVIYNDSSKNFALYTGYVRSANHFYISPGRPDNQELNPYNINTKMNVCNLVSTPNQKGKWLFFGFNGDLNNALNKIPESK